MRVYRLYRMDRVDRVDRLDLHGFTLACLMLLAYYCFFPPGFPSGDAWLSWCKETFSISLPSGSDQWVDVPTRHLRPRQTMPVPGTAHMLDTTVEVPVAQLRPFTEFGCSLQPEAVDNPFFVADPLVRTDITDGENGNPMTITIQIQDVNNCEPLADVFVSVWHANATGYYSDYPPIAEPDFDPPGPAPISSKPTALRGQYVTSNVGNYKGLVSFTTIYPGPSLNDDQVATAPHISFIVHPKSTDSDGNITAPSRPSKIDDEYTMEVLHSGQIFFDDKLNDLIYASDPYTRPSTPWSSYKIPTIDNADDANYRAEFAGGADENGKPLDPVAWYRFNGQVLAYVGIGVDTTKRYKFSTSKIRQE